MKSKILIAVMLILISLVQVSAITASLGNSRMVLRLSPGQSIEKSLRVINSNDVPVAIELSPVGDLTDSISFAQESFTLQPGEEKNAEFTITAQDDESQSETKINVKFIPEEGNTVGLAATIVIITSEEAGSSQEEQEAEAESDSDTPNNTASDNSSEPSTLVLLSLLSIGLLTALILLLIFSSIKLKKSVKRRENN